MSDRIIDKFWSEGDVVNGCTTGRLPKSGNARGVATEGSDVGAYPFKSDTLIPEADVGSLAGGAGETEDV